MPKNQILPAFAKYCLGHTRMWFYAVYIQSRNCIILYFIKPHTGSDILFLHKLFPRCRSVWVKTEWEETWKRFFFSALPNYLSSSISKNKFIFHKAPLLQLTATLPNCLRAIQCHFDHGYLAKREGRRRRRKKRKSISPNYLCWRSLQSRWPLVS